MTPRIYNFLSLLLCATSALVACSTRNKVLKYRLNGEKIDLYSYGKFGHSVVVLENHNKNHGIYYILKGRGLMGGRELVDDGHPGQGSYVPIVDSFDRFYYDARVWQQSAYDSLGNEVKRNNCLKYPVDSLIGAERIYISELERGLLTEAVKQKIRERRAINAKHAGHLKKPIDSSVLFFIRVPFSLQNKYWK